jgi:hypothetical protein
MGIGSLRSSAAQTDAAIKGDRVAVQPIDLITSADKRLKCLKSLRNIEICRIANSA